MAFLLVCVAPSVCVSPAGPLRVGRGARRGAPFAGGSLGRSNRRPIHGKPTGGRLRERCGRWRGTGRNKLVSAASGAPEGWAEARKHSAQREHPGTFLVPEGAAAVRRDVARVVSASRFPVYRGVPARLLCILPRAYLARLVPGVRRFPCIRGLRPNPRLPRASVRSLGRLASPSFSCLHTGTSGKAISLRRVFWRVGTNGLHCYGIKELTGGCPVRLQSKPC